MTTIAADTSDLKYCLAEDVDPFFAQRRDIDDAFTAQLLLWWRLGLHRSIERVVLGDELRRIAVFASDSELLVLKQAVLERMRSRA